jgi:hypothetical protein
MFVFCVRKKIKMKLLLLEPATPSGWTLLCELGETTLYIEAPSFRFLQKDVAAMSEAVQDVLGDETADKVLLMNAFDNSYFVAKTEDGHFIPPRKDIMLTVKSRAHRRKQLSK